MLFHAAKDMKKRFCHKKIPVVQAGIMKSKKYAERCDIAPINYQNVQVILL